MARDEHVVLDDGAMPDVIPAPEDAAVAHLREWLKRVVFEHKGVSPDFDIARDSRAWVDEAHEFIPESLDTLAHVFARMVEVARTYSNEGAVRFGRELSSCRSERDGRQTSQALSVAEKLRICCEPNDFPVSRLGEVEMRQLSHFAHTEDEKFHGLMPSVSLRKPKTHEFDIDEDAAPVVTNGIRMGEAGLFASVGRR